jgi:hypothetical protein
VDVLFDRPADFMHLYFGKPMYSEYYLLQSQYSFSYWVLDNYAYFASKLFVPVEIICFESYLATAIVTAALCYIGVWLLFLIFCREFPGIEKQFAWSILFIPSVVFWGSGIMKDSITLSATCLYVYGFYWFFTQRRRKVKYLLVLALGVFLLITIKPYILFALLPGSALWFVALRVARIRNPFLRFMFTPSLLAVGIVLGLFILQQMGDTLGKYSLETVLKTASTAQRDLKQSYYAGNSFDIGNYEPTIAGALSVAHKAIFATLFRPMIFTDVKNVVMLVAALENLVILGFCIYLLIRLRFFRFFDLITTHSLLMFSFIFAIFFAFSVGISISNFGALVRLKIPCIPFFISSLVILNHLLKRKYVPEGARKAVVPGSMVVEVQRG